MQVLIMTRIISPSLLITGIRHYLCQCRHDSVPRPGGDAMMTHHGMILVPGPTHAVGLTE
jgi:hypothetical protein